MLQRLLPPRIDNVDCGHRLALWLLGLLVLIRSGYFINVVFVAVMVTGLVLALRTQEHHVASP